MSARPHVTVPAGHPAGVEDRLDIQAGGFFDTVPPDVDAYILKTIIHDRADEWCRRILMRNQLAANHKETGRVLMVEVVVPDNGEPAPAKFLDIEMLVKTPGGKERKVFEFATLLASAGLELERVMLTRSPIVPHRSPRALGFPGEATSARLDQRFPSEVAKQ